MDGQINETIDLPLNIEEAEDLYTLLTISIDAINKSLYAQAVLVLNEDQIKAMRDLLAKSKKFKKEIKQIMMELKTEQKKPKSIILLKP